ncbi:MAG: hypothetical protein ACU0DK_14365 [Pseudooceanicola sp.]|uniref:hypothetical protein n=1 Tax=Pseudooceanicola nanhaiensis TaxID=375761 RepID=UPI004059735A
MENPATHADKKAFARAALDALNEAWAYYTPETDAEVVPLRKEPVPDPIGVAYYDAA